MIGWDLTVFLFSIVVYMLFKSFFKEADRHELPGISDLNTIIEKQTKTLIMSYIH